jgi:hypothetical protein
MVLRLIHLREQEDRGGSFWQTTIPINLNPY